MRSGHCPLSCSHSLSLALLTVTDVATALPSARLLPAPDACPTPMPNARPNPTPDARPALVPDATTNARRRPRPDAAPNILASLLMPNVWHRP